MGQVPNETMPDGQRVRVVYVPNRFLSRFWAVLTSLLLHPFTYTIIRTVPPDNRAE